jgi:putative salt-induced outer membrane protein YdiY
MTRYLAWALLTAWFAAGAMGLPLRAEGTAYRPENPEVIPLPPVQPWTEAVIDPDVEPADGMLLRLGEPGEPADIFLPDPATLISHSAPVPPAAPAPPGSSPSAPASDSSAPATETPRLFTEHGTLITEPWLPPVVRKFMAEDSLALPKDTAAGPPKLWSGSLSMGLNGTEGNSQSFNVRVGWNAKWKTPMHVITCNGDYHRTTNHSTETANRALLDTRYERLFKDSPWTCYTHGTGDYDSFQPYVVRVTSDTGVGYRFIKNETTSLLGRFGAGFSHEMEGANRTYKPEFLFGGDFEHRFTPRHKLTFSAEYTPDIVLWREYRLKTKASWEVLLDSELNLSLQVNVLDRYNNDAQGAKPNDLDYSVVLLWAF